VNENDVPIVGRRRVAARLGISASALKRWLADPEIAARLQLHDFIFKFGSRWATTDRLAHHLLDHVMALDSRDAAQRQVAEVAEQFRKRGVA
jgi:hypothetical protein